MIARQNHKWKETRPRDQEKEKKETKMVKIRNNRYA